MTAKHMQPAIDAIEAAGFKAYMRNPDDTWVFFTDGTRIGYLQSDRFRGFSLSTVHVPNRTTGTGFSMGETCNLDKARLESAFVTAPAWANDRDRASVCKWKSWEAFQNAGPFNQGYKQVSASS